VQPDPNELDKRLALLEQKLDTLLNNHLAHMQKDIDWMKYVIYSTAIGIIALLAKAYLP
jgi:hypothetical protein